ncbi:hypothetical protein TUA1478L_01960 [Lactiplantibacillus plantarum]
MPTKRLYIDGISIGKQIIGTTFNTLFFGFLVASWRYLSGLRAYIIPSGVLSIIKYLLRKY